VSASSKVTVIVPNYNHARFLKERIESVIGQTYANLEIILMDDCSLDDSREILEYYATVDKRIRLVFNEKNSGSTFKQWNKGISLASGEYVWIAESDDVADKSLLTKLVNQLEQAPQAGLAYCQSRLIDDTSKLILGQVEQDVSQGKLAICLSGHALVEQYMPITNIIPNASAVVMRRSMLQQVGPAPENMRLAGDWLFWVRCLLQADACFVAEPLNYFRTHQSNVRTSTLREGLNLQEMAAVLKFIKQEVALSASVQSRAVDTLIEKWFYTFIYSNLSLAGHKAFVKAMTEIEPDFSKVFRRQLFKRLTNNRFSGLRMFLGDKLPSLIKPRS
jgi:glycosyltransferase involved in cell wall biosynthesis